MTMRKPIVRFEGSQCIGIIEALLQRVVLPRLPGPVVAKIHCIATQRMLRGRTHEYFDVVNASYDKKLA
jgi:hypothetical protein